MIKYQNFGILLAGLASTLCSSIPQQSHDQRLKNDLWKNYNWQGSPIDGILDFYINFSIMGVIHIDQLEEQVDLGAIVRMGWYDPRLTWDPAQYNNIQVIVIRELQNRFYIPEIGCFQTEPSLYFESLDSNNAQISHNGSIYVSNPGSVRFLHNFTLLNYPQDIQQIGVDLVTPSMSNDKINIIPWHNNPLTGKPRYSLAAIEEHRASNIQWKIDACEGFLIEKFYRGKMYTFQHIKMTLTRKAETVNKIIIQPGIFLTIQSLQSYFIEIKTSTRISYTTSIFLSLILYLVMVIKFLPLQSDAPHMESVFNTFIFYVFLVLIFNLSSSWYMNNYEIVQKKYAGQIIVQQNIIYRKYYKRLKRKNKRIIKNLREKADLQYISIASEFFNFQDDQEQISNKPPQSQSQQKQLFFFNTSKSQNSVSNWKSTFCNQLFKFITDNTNRMASLKLYLLQNINIIYLDRSFLVLFSIVFLLTQIRFYMERTQYQAEQDRFNS